MSAKDRTTHDTKFARQIISPLAAKKTQHKSRIVDDYLSHGKRQNVGKASIFKIKEIKNILMNIVDNIE